MDSTTNRRVGRNPPALLEISEVLDLHVVMGSGWYRDSWHRPEVNSMTPDALVESLVMETMTGVDGMGVRPGIIGEIGAGSDYLRAREERVMLAAARARLRTERPITLHARASRVGMA